MEKHTGSATPWGLGRHTPAYQFLYGLSVLLPSPALTSGPRVYSALYFELKSLFLASSTPCVSNHMLNTQKARSISCQNANSTFSDIVRKKQRLRISVYLKKDNNYHVYETPVSQF